MLIQSFYEGYLLVSNLIPAFLIWQRNVAGNDIILAFNDGTTVRKGQIYFPTKQTAVTRLMTDISTIRVYGVDKI